MNGTVGDAVTHGQVSHRVHGSAAHPPIAAVRSVSALLVDRWTITWISYLIPPNANTAVCGDRVIGDEGFVIAKVAIGKAIHQTITKRIELLSGAKLGDTRTAVAGARKRRHRNINRN